MENEQNLLNLENLMIAAPCDVEWEDMVGNDRIRRCDACQLNVYNVKSLTSKELELLLQSEQGRSGRLCMQLYRRADGTLITADCPRGLKKIRAFSGRLWRTVAAVIALVLTGSAALAEDKDKGSSAKADKPTYPAGTRTGGLICPPNVLKGAGKTDPSKSTDSAKSMDTAKPMDSAKPKDTTKPADNLKHADQDKTAKDNNAETNAAGEGHHGKAHYTAFNLYREGQQLEKEGAYAKAAEVYQQALTLMSHQKHDPKFHLRIATALSRVKAKAGINQ